MGVPPSPSTNIVATNQAATTVEVKTMNIPEQGVLLRIFIGENDREPGTDQSLFAAIVRRAREAHLAGATVLKSPLGFGRHSRVHTSKLLELSTDLPIVIEIVRSEEKIQAFLPVIDTLVTEGLSPSRPCACSSTSLPITADAQYQRASPGRPRRLLRHRSGIVSSA